MRGFTQSGLAGDRITRNMLSQIESGSASPSVQTILYLAGRLDVPVGYFLSDSDDDFAYKKIQYLDEIKTAFTKEDYSGCIEIIEQKLGETDDEISQILAQCNLYLGEESFRAGAFVTCAKYLRASLSHCEKTVYNCNWIRARALLLLSVTEDIDLPMHNIGTDFEALAEKSIGFETYLYMRVLSFVDEMKTEAAQIIFDNFKFENQALRAHLGAKLMMSEGRYLSAVECMNDILYKYPKDRISALVRYKLYTDLETCCRETNDFQGAYGYASKRLHLISDLKS